MQWCVWWSKHLGCDFKQQVQFISEKLLHLLPSTKTNKREVFIQSVPTPKGSSKRSRWYPILLIPPPKKEINPDEAQNRADYRRCRIGYSLTGNLPWNQSGKKWQEQDRSDSEFWGHNTYFKIIALSSSHGKNSKSSRTWYTAPCHPAWSTKHGYLFHSCWQGDLQRSAFGTKQTIWARYCLILSDEQSCLSYCDTFEWDITGKRNRRSPPALYQRDQFQAEDKRLPFSGTFFLNTDGRASFFCWNFRVTTHTMIEKINGRNLHPKRAGRPKKISIMSLE